MDPVGRQAELGALARALGDVARGMGRTVLVSGDAGIGKTTLVDAFRGDAEAAGAIWLWGAAWEDAGAPAYWPWVQVVRSAARVAEDLVASRAADLGPLAPERSVAEPPDQFALYDAVADLLATLTERSPVVVVLEDLHAAGLASVRLLEFVARFSRHSGLLLIGTYRPAEARVDAELHAVLARIEDHGTALSPTPFGDDDITAVLEAAGVRVERELVTEVADRTQGNPLFVAHVARRLAGGGTTADAGLPLGLRDDLRRQAARAVGVSGAAETVDAAAVLGVGLGVDLLATVLGTTPSDVRPALEAAATAGLLRREETGRDRFEFTHAVVREALYDGINPARRAQLHLLAGRALAEAGAGSDRLGHHFAAAWPAGGAAEAVEHCRAAGQRATAAHAHAEAVTSFRDALTAHGRLPDGDPYERCALLIELAAARLRAGRSVEGADTARLAVKLAFSLDDAELASRAVLLLASNLPFNEVDHEVIVALQRADELWTGRASATRAAVLSRLAGVTVPVDRTHAAALARHAEEVALALGEEVPERERRAALAAALTAQVDVTWGTHEPAGARELARRLTAVAVDPATEAAGATWDLVFSLELVDLPAAEDAVVTLERVAERERQPSLRHLALSRRAMLTTLVGDPSDGLRLAHEARAIAIRADLPDGDAVCWGQLFGVWRMTGLTADDAALMEQIARHLAAHSPFAAAHAAAVVQMLDQRGDVDAARRLFASTMASVPALPRDLIYAWTLTLLAEDAVALGDADAGELLYRLLLPFADRFVVAAGGVVCLGSASHQLGQLAAQLDLRDAAHRHLTQAVAAHRRAGCLGLAAKSEDALAALSPPSVAFDLDGQVVTVRYGPQVARLPNSLGLRYLSLLAANPGLDIEAVRLVALESGFGDDRATGDGPDTMVALPDEILDKTALASYRARLTEIDDELDEASVWHDQARTTLLEQERDHLFAELSRVVGLGGRTRRFADESERARVNVTRAIRAAIRKIKAQSTPLGAHLDQCVTTGGRCRYEPPTG